MPDVKEEGVGRISRYFQLLLPGGIEYLMRSIRTHTVVGRTPAGNMVNQSFGTLAQNHYLSGWRQAFLLGGCNLTCEGRVEF